MLLLVLDGAAIISTANGAKRLQKACVFYSLYIFIHTRMYADAHLSYITSVREKLNNKKKSK